MVDSLGGALSQAHLRTLGCEDPRYSCLKLPRATCQACYRGAPKVVRCPPARHFLGALMVVGMGFASRKLSLMLLGDSEQGFPDDYRVRLRLRLQHHEFL